MRNNLYGMNVERTVRYDVHELRVKDWQSMIGSPIEEAYGLEPDQKAILGYYNGNPITAGGEKNYIENVFQMGDGKLGVEVRETVPFGTGTKVDPVKGLIHGVNNDEFARIKEGLNKYHQVLPAAHIPLSRARARTLPSAAEVQLLMADADCSSHLDWQIEVLHARMIKAVGNAGDPACKRHPDHDLIAVSGAFLAVMLRRLIPVMHFPPTAAEALIQLNSAYPSMCSERASLGLRFRPPGNPYWTHGCPTSPAGRDKGWVPAPPIGLRPSRSSHPDFDRKSTRFSLWKSFRAPRKVLARIFT